MIAQVYVDVGVPHLDRTFDYAVPPQWEDRIKPGIRVKVGFHGRRLPGFVVGLADSSEQEKLVSLATIVSDEVVLPAESVRLIRTVADHCAGTFMDVARVAVPPRYARAEQRQPEHSSPPEPGAVADQVDTFASGLGDRGKTGDGRAGQSDDDLESGHTMPTGVGVGPLVWDGPASSDPGSDNQGSDGLVVPDSTSTSLDDYPGGTGLKEALRRGQSPRVSWTLSPVANRIGDWAGGLAGLVADTLASGRSVVVLVPDAKDCARALDSISPMIGGHRIVTLTADKGPQARYSAFLAAVRGQARVVVGTRAAVYTPVRDLGLIAVWDEADGSYAEPRVPYPALRDIVAIRATQCGAAVVFASYSRSAQIQNWVEKGWLREIGPVRGPAGVRTAAVRVASQEDRSLGRDVAARTSRLPHDAFAVLQAGLSTGPVLVWVPWVGHRRNFWCPQCGQVARCQCGGGLEEKAANQVCCQVCGRSAEGWTCSCGSKRWWAVTVGSARTAEELASSFKNVEVLRSDSTTRLTKVPATPAIVIATPGSEPDVEGGYAAAVILDAAGFLARGDIRVAEEAVRRWMAVIALVRPGQDSGVVLVVGPGQDRAVQAVLRLDPVGFARRELQDRRQAGFPPATRMAAFTGEQAAVEEAGHILGQAGYVELLGPVQEIDSEDFRLLARVPASRGSQFASLLAGMTARRWQGGKPGRLTVRLDPDWLGG
ncbi:MAG: primosome assembly protein PriA [Propionibacteriaceae bacterium]|nr:primosome assembly protein PriA [Propionibacteriaceae bacterium]